MFCVFLVLCGVCTPAVVGDASSERALLHPRATLNTELELNNGDETVLLQVAVAVAPKPGLSHAAGLTPTIDVKRPLVGTGIGVLGKGKNHNLVESTPKLHSEPAPNSSPAFFTAIRHKVGPELNTSLTQRTVGTFVDLLEPNKSKVVLAMIEIITPLGFLGIDRLYLGNGGFAIAKFAFAICTMGIGGFVWFTFDLLLVVWNGLTNQEVINACGMVAVFQPTSIEAGFYLSIVALISNVLVGIKVLRSILQRSTFKSSSQSRKRQPSGISKA